MKIKRIYIGVLLLIFSLLPSTIYLPILFPIIFYLILLTHGNIQKKSILFIGKLAALFACGLVYADYSNIPPILKDTWYVLKIIALSTAGTLIGYISTADDKWIKTTAVLSSLGLVLGFLLSKSEVYTPLLGPILIAAFYLSASENHTSRSSLIKWLYMSPVILITLISMSRTTLLFFAVALLGARGAFTSFRKSSYVALTLALIVFSIGTLLPELDIQEYSFLGKVSNSINELSFVTDYDMTSITTNWRGFEAFKAFDAWSKASLGEKIFGLGVGTSIDIGFYYDLLEDQSFRYLPILHNGYFMILVKYGLLGIIFFIAFITYSFLLPVNNHDKQSVFAKRLGTTSSVLLLLTMSSITGPFNIKMLDGVTLLLAWSIGLQLQRSKYYHATNLMASMKTQNFSTVKN